MKVSYPKDMSYGFNWFTILMVSGDDMLIKWDDGEECYVTAEIDTDIKSGAKITYPKQHTLALIKKYR